MQILKSDDGLREEILKDAKTKADRILNKAQREKEKILSDIDAETKKFKEEFTNSKTIETNSKIKLIYSTVDMEVKKEVIKYSNDLVNDVFSDILKKIQSNKTIPYKNLIINLIIKIASKIDSESFILEVAKSELAKITKNELSKIKLNRGEISQIREGDFDNGYKIYSSDAQIGAYLSLNKFINELQEDERINIYKMFVGGD